MKRIRQAADSSLFMPRRKLPNYLRTHRKRYGLSQAEVTYLLGEKSQAVVSRHEQFQRAPSLKDALAYQALFGTPVAELFAGMYQQAERETSRRARIFANKLKKGKPERLRARKADLLRAVAITPDINKENP